MTYRFENQTTSALRFACVLLFVVGVHIVTISSLLSENEEAQDQAIDDGGIVFIDLSPIDVSVAAELVDAPIGPEAVETAETPETPEEVELAKKVDEPVVNRTHYEPDDEELRFKTANPDQEESETENEADVPPTEVQDQAATEASSAVEETTAPPPVEATEAEKSVAQEEGVSKELKAKISRWQKKLVVHLFKFKRYPRAAKKKRIQGRVELWFKMDKYGRVLDQKLLNGADLPLLAQDAMSLLKRAGQLPAPPNDAPGETFEFTLPIDYSIR